jgi:thiaminase
MDLWTAPEFAAYVSWIEANLNRHVSDWPESSLAPLRRVFRQAARYKYMLWEMIARRETWPI